MIPFIGSRARFGARADAEPVAAVSGRPDRLPPPAVVEVPGDGLAQSGLEGFAWLPAELAPQFRRVHRIAPIVARPIRHKRDQLRMRPVRRVRQYLVEQLADAGDDFEIG